MATEQHPRMTAEEAEQLRAAAALLRELADRANDAWSYNSSPSLAANVARAHERFGQAEASLFQAVLVQAIYLGDPLANEATDEWWATTPLGTGGMPTATFVGRGEFYSGPRRGDRVRVDLTTARIGGKAAVQSLDRRGAWLYASPSELTDWRGA